MKHIYGQPEYMFAILVLYNRLTRGISVDTEDKKKKAADSDTEKTTRTEPKSPGSVTETLTWLVRFIAPPAVLLGCLWIVFAAYCIGVHLLRNGFRSTEEFDPRFDLAAFCCITVNFVWRAVIVPRYRPAAQLNKQLYGSNVARLAQWAVSVACWERYANILSITAAAFFEGPCDAIPGACYARRTTDNMAIIASWVIFGAIVSGTAITAAFVMIIRLMAGALSVIFLIDTVIKQSPIQLAFGLVDRYFFTPLENYLVQPADQYVLQPASQYIFRPIFRTAFGILEEPFKDHVTKPLARIFPGPQSKKERFLPEPSASSLAVAGLCQLVLFVLVSVSVYTVSPEDKHLYAYISEINMAVHRALFFSLSIWVLWRATSALNFASSVRLDRLVYQSSIGWVLQGVLCVLWLSTAWKVMIISMLVVLGGEGVIGRPLRRLTLPEKNFLLSAIKIYRPVAYSMAMAPATAGCAFMFVSVITVLAFCVRRYLGLVQTPLLAASANQSSLDRKETREEMRKSDTQRV